jgi:surface polysaccharide O-acyltransferase-like enzyme
MAILLIYLFNPITSQSIVITGHTKILLYLFGILLLVTTNWNNFLTPSPWFIDLQKIVGPTK